MTLRAYLGSSNKVVKGAGMAGAYHIWGVCVEILGQWYIRELSID